MITPTWSAKPSTSPHKARETKGREGRERERREREREREGKASSKVHQTCWCHLQCPSTLGTHPWGSKCLKNPPSPVPEKHSNANCQTPWHSFEWKHQALQEDPTPDIIYLILRAHLRGHLREERALRSPKSQGQPTHPIGTPTRWFANED